MFGMDRSETLGGEDPSPEGLVAGYPARRAAAFLA